MFPKRSSQEQNGYALRSLSPSHCHKKKRRRGSYSPAPETGLSWSEATRLDRSQLLRGRSRRPVVRAAGIGVGTIDVVIRVAAEGVAAGNGILALRRTAEDTHAVVFYLIGRDGVADTTARAVGFDALAVKVDAAFR